MTFLRGTILDISNATTKYIDRFHQSIIIGIKDGNIDIRAVLIGIEYALGIKLKGYSIAGGIGSCARAKIPIIHPSPLGMICKRGKYQPDKKKRKQDPFHSQKLNYNNRPKILV